MERVEAVVIGAGVVGLAIARALALAGREVVILEREARIGTRTSARNSGVIHAGLYYPKDSLKARLCVAGRAMLYEYCARRHVAHARVGKLIVATEPGEVAALDAIAAAAAANGVGDIKRLSGADARSLEPEVRAEAALLSPSTGIVDAHGLMLSLLGEAEEAGAMLAPETPVERIGEGLVVETGGAAPMRLRARVVVNAAGHGAPPLAPAPVPQFFARGCYFALAGRGPFARLVYPVPVPGGLGVHSTLDLAGRTRFGPDVEWIGGEDWTVDPGRADAFAAAIRRYWPGLPDGALTPDFAGVRPKISGPGAPAADFRIDCAGGLVGLYGIESPGLTSCLAIADHVARLVEPALAGERA